MSKIEIDERAKLHICAACGDDLIRGEMVSHVTRVEDGVVVRKSFHPDCYEEAQPTEGTLEAGPMHPRIPPIKTGNDYLMSFDDGYEYEVYRITKLSGDAENCEIRFRRMGDGSCTDT